jgi:hypothetical protein
MAPPTTTECQGRMKSDPLAPVQTDPCEVAMIVAEASP